VVAVSRAPAVMLSKVTRYWHIANLPVFEFVATGSNRPSFRAQNEDPSPTSGQSVPASIETHPHPGLLLWITVLQLENSYFTKQHDEMTKKMTKKERERKLLPHLRMVWGAMTKSTKDDDDVASMRQGS
jgi:hypothetical protein